jgi:hypothetical protein
MSILDYALLAVPAAQLLSFQSRLKDLSGFPAYWSPEIYNNPYLYPGKHWVWPIPPHEREVIVYGDERPNEPWNQRAYWRRERAHA